MKNSRTFNLQLIFLGTLALTLSSCSFFQQDSITDYLKDKGNRVEIAETHFSHTVHIDNEGYISIPSTGDMDITFLLQNPQGLKIDYCLRSEIDDKINYTIEKYSRFYTEVEKDIFKYTNSKTNINDDTVVYELGQQLLYRIERSQPGVDFNPKLGVLAQNYTYAPSESDFYTDEELASYVEAWKKSYEDLMIEVPAQEPENFHANIPLYQTKIRINTPPPFVQGSCIMVDSSRKNTDTDGNYVICFNLPDALFNKDGIHRDVKKIYVTGLDCNDSDRTEKFEKGIELEIDFENETFTSFFNEKETGLVENLKKISENNGFYNDGMPAVSFTPGNHPVYIWDNGHYSQRDSVHTYTITLEDEKGLRSEVKLNTRYLRLETPSAYCNGKKYNKGAVTIPIPDGKTYNVLNMFAPVKAVGTVVKNIQDASIYYEIYSLKFDISPNGELKHDEYADYQEGCVQNEKDVYLVDKTLYEIFAYGRKDKYLDSEESNWIITSGNWRRVPVEVEVGLSDLRCEFEFDKDNIIILVKTKSNGEVVRLFNDGTVSGKVKLYEKDKETGEEVLLGDEEAAGRIASLKVTLCQNVEESPQTIYTFIDNDNLKKEVSEYVVGESGTNLQVTESELTEKQCEAAINLAEFIAQSNVDDLNNQNFYIKMECKLTSGTELIVPAQNITFEEVYVQE